jgi:hypothetical protein
VRAVFPHFEEYFSFCGDCWPHARIARHETHSGLLLLAAVATGPQAVLDPFGYVTRMLYEAGWASSDGTPVDRWQARDAAADTHVALVRLGALTPDRPGAAPDQPTPGGALFARAVLRTWPA